MSNCIAAMATAPGKASLCVVRISGDDAYKVAKKVFVPINKNHINKSNIHFAPSKNLLV